MRILILLTLACLGWSANGLAQTCNGLPATLIGTPGDDDIDGTGGDDVIVGLGGNDRINGFGGNDTICGGDGNDDLIGGGGDDQLWGDAGDDVMEGNAGLDACDGVTGADSADEACEIKLNTDTQVYPVTLTAGDGTDLDGALYMPMGDALPGDEYRQLAMIVSHGAMGSFSASVPKIIGLQAAPLGFSVLALDRRDAGMDAGGGGVLFEDATLDIGVGIDLLAALGYDAIYVAGHSQGTQNASVYPSFSMDPRVAAVGLYGTVDDGRAVARDLLFNELLAPVGYDDLVILAQDLVAMGEGDVLRAWDTIFGQPVFRTPGNFLSFWGPDSLSVPVREISKLEVPVLLLRAAGDDFTPDEMSQNVLAAALDAGVDATYTVLPYPFPLTDQGGNAHGFVGVERETIATTLAWLDARVPEATATRDDIRMPEDDGSGTNFRPLAYEGVKLTVLTSQDQVTLDGTGSSDIDGSIVSYLWAQIGGTPVTLDDPASAMPSFANPGISSGGNPAQPVTAAVGSAPAAAFAAASEELVFELTVTDDDGATDTMPVTVEIVEDESLAVLSGGGNALAPPALLALLMAAGLLARRRL